MWHIFIWCFVPFENFSATKKARSCQFRKSSKLFKYFFNKYECVSMKACSKSFILSSYNCYFVRPYTSLKSCHADMSFRVLKKVQDFYSKNCKTSAIISDLRGLLIFLVFYVHLEYRLCLDFLVGIIVKPEPSENLAQCLLYC